MSVLLTLGAINKKTNNYEPPYLANKKETYKCPDCDKDVMLRKGEILRPHFAHYKSDKPCNYYNHPGESQIHKDAKMLMKSLIENKTHIQFIRECASCKINAELYLPEITKDSIVTLEYRFKYEGKLRIADVAQHTLNGEIKGIYEICNTHKTCSENRPEPWVEIDVNSLLTSVNKSTGPLIITCVRCEKCKDCIDKENRINCGACRGSGTSYWFDDCYGSCLQCCCINCGNFDDECQCKD